ncbi:hypothetical protein [Kribbella steppae]|uniref:hypothetical protein n=1 Tax=Kribbella steppae TaxID=2512223 RepID=UPI001F53EB53|nr:hypothetical protein [Kribbella steppae]
MTFPQWRTQLRLHTALRLLAGGDSVTRVAHQCGWGVDQCVHRHVPPRLRSHPWVTQRLIEAMPDRGCGSTAARSRAGEHCHP